MLLLEGDAGELVDPELQDIKDASVGPDVGVKKARLLLGIIADYVDDEEIFLTNYLGADSVMT